MSESRKYEPEPIEPPIYIENEKGATYIHSLGFYWLTSEVDHGGSTSYHVDCHPEQARVYEKTIKNARRGAPKVDQVSVFDDAEYDMKKLKSYQFIGYHIVARVQGIAAGRRIYDGSVFFDEEPLALDDVRVQNHIEDANHIVVEHLRSQQRNQEAA